MPIYQYKCSDHGLFEIFSGYSSHKNIQECPVCGELCKQVITAPMLIIPKEMRYISPATGAVITSEAARKRDMANSGCIQYEPGMRQDADRRVKESDDKLDRLVEGTVAKEIEKMPAKDREALETAVTHFDIEPVRL